MIYNPFVATPSIILYVPYRATCMLHVKLNIPKLTHKSLYDETFPEHLKLNLHKVSAYSLRSLIVPVLSILKE